MISNPSLPEKKCQSEGPSPPPSRNVYDNRPSLMSRTTREGGENVSLREAGADKKEEGVGRDPRTAKTAGAVTKAQHTPFGGEIVASQRPAQKNTDKIVLLCLPWRRF